jgi:hypothetical protein
MNIVQRLYRFVSKGVETRMKLVELTGVLDSREDLLPYRANYNNAAVFDVLR